MTYTSAEIAALRNSLNFYRVKGLVNDPMMSWIDIASRLAVVALQSNREPLSTEALRRFAFGKTDLPADHLEDLKIFLSSSETARSR